MARDPAYRWVPPHKQTYGDLAVDVADQLGMSMDDEQRDILDAVHAEDEPGIPTCFEVAVVAPRQNLKTSTLEIAAITDVFVLAEPLHLWTAHLFSTARKTFEHMIGMIGSNDDFRSRCVWPPRTSHGEEEIELLTGEKIEFKARSMGGGRGFAGVSKVTLDEALFLDASAMGALLPTMATRPDAQVRYGSSAGLTRSAVLRDIRDRGRVGKESRLAYFEWGAPREPCLQLDCEHKRDTPGCALDREDLWALANPALGRRIPLKLLRAFRRSMPPEEFAREFLSWWDEPQEVADRAISVPVWEKSQSETPAKCLDPVALGIEVSPARQAALVAAGWLDDGTIQGEVIATGQGTAWILDVLLRVITKVDPAVLVIDKAGPAGSLLPDIEAAGLEPLVLTTTQRAAADQGLVEDLEQDKVRIVSSPAFDAAAEAVTWKQLPNARAFDRRHVTSNIAPIVGLSIARYGLLTAPKPRRGPVPAPEPIRSGEASAGATVDLMTAGF